MTQSALDRPRIGARLKAARTAQRRTLGELADACGVTKGYLSKIEHDRASASVATLIRVCAALDVPVGSLFDDVGPGEVVRAGDYPRIEFGGTGMAEYLLTPRGERRMQVLFSDIEPGGGSGDESYRLPVDVEFVYVVSGRLRLTFEATDFELGAGDAFTFSPRQRHAFVAVGEGPASVLWVLAPALPEDAREVAMEET